MAYLGKTISSLLLLSTLSAACFLPTGSDSTATSSPLTSECSIDLDCATSSSCRVYRCVEHQCTYQDTPDGVDAPNFTGTPLRCERLVCDGKGQTRTAIDPTAIPTDPAPACKKYGCDNSGQAILLPSPDNVPRSEANPCQRVTCDASGNVSYAVDTTNVPTDMPNDCRIAQCDAQGNPTFSPDVNDLPHDTAGDCMKDTCTAQGSTTKVIDDTDPPTPSTCFAYACQNGTVKSTPINPTAKCSDLGFVCGSDGQCGTCPAPDASCTDPGPGSRSASSAHDFNGIGRTDSGGRYVCGAVPNGQSEFYTYYDDGTGFLATFDPYFEIRPASGSAEMCVYFDCPSVTCPSGTTADSASGQSGCCWNAAGGAYSGHAIDFCSGGRVTMKVTTTAACTGYELHFHD